MTLAQRWTISNMGVEVGAKFAIFEADDKVDEFLKGRANPPYERASANADAAYESVHEFDFSDLVPMVARLARIDPAVVSAPLISTLVDATGLLIFYTIARAIHHYLLS